QRRLGSRAGLEACTDVRLWTTHVSGQSPPADSGTSSPDDPAQAPTDPPPIPSVVWSLLQELRAQVDCTLFPADGQYAMLMQAPAGTGAGVLLPGGPLERASVDPRAKAHLRTLLLAAVEAVRSSTVRGASAHLAPYFAALDVRSLPGPHCV